MNQYRILSIDETGKASFSHPSELFILSGVVMPESMKKIIDQQMRTLKKDFFGDEEVVFHSRDMARHKGYFKNLSNPYVETKFWKKFIKTVEIDDIAIYFIITDKKKAAIWNWQPSTILRRSYLRLLSEFARHLKITGSCGKIMNESEPSQDIHLIYAHNRLQSVGIGDGSVESQEYKRMVTCLSLVNKANLDIDIQIADALAPIAGIKYRLENKQKVELGISEKVKYDLIEKKLNGKTNLSLYEVLI
jgi:hypothetical protein